jgi:PEP-CTERM motif
MKTTLKLALTCAALATVVPAQAAVTYLDFENIAPYPNGSNVLVNGYYNGGTSSIGTSGPNLGVAFTSDVLLLCMNTAGTNCSNTSRNGEGISTSARGAIFFLSGVPIMNVAAGFDTGFAGVFSAPFTAGTTVTVYDGLNATGSILGSLVLGTTPTGPCNATISFTAAYCKFDAFSIAFAGTAKSVKFGGTLNQQVFDDLTFGSVVAGGAVPEPATWAMMLSGFGLVGGAMRYRRRKTAATFG